MFHKILFLATGTYAPLSTPPPSSTQEPSNSNANATNNQHHSILPQLSHLLPLLAMKTFLNSSLTPYFFEWNQDCNSTDLWFRDDVPPPKYLEEFLEETKAKSLSDSSKNSEDSEGQNGHRPRSLRYDRVYLPAGIVFENSTTTKFCRKLKLGTELKLSQTEFREEIIARVDYSLQELTLNACFLSEQSQRAVHRDEITEFEKNQSKNAETKNVDLDEETNHHHHTYFSCLAKCKYLKKVAFLNLSVFNETSTYVIAPQHQRQATSLLFDPLDFVQSTIAPIAEHLESLTFLSHASVSQGPSAPSMYLNYLVQDMLLTLRHRMINLKQLSVKLPSSMEARYQQQLHATNLDRIIASCFVGATPSNVTSELQKYIPGGQTDEQKKQQNSSSSSSDEDFSSYFEDPSPSNSLSSPTKTTIPKKKIIFPKNHNDDDDDNDESSTVFCDVIQKSLQHLSITVDRDWHFGGLTLPKLLSDFRCLYTLSLTCGMASTDMKKLVEEFDFAENLSFLPPTIQNMTLSISQSTPPRCLEVISAALCESLVEFKYWGQLSYDSLLIFAKNLGGILRSFTFLFGLIYINPHFRQCTSLLRSDDEAMLTETTKRDQVLRPLLLLEKIQFLEINDFGLNRRPIDKYFSVECYDDREIETLKTKFGESAVERVLERFEFDVPFDNNNKNINSVQTLILAGYTNGTCLEKCFPKLENIRLKTETDMSFFFVKNYSKFGPRLKSLRVDCVNEIVADFEMLSVIGSFSPDLEVLEMDGLPGRSMGFPLDEFETLIREKFQFLSQLKKLRVLKGHVSGLDSRFLWKVANNEILN